jgi:cytosine/adenosine deaminase-related metal-dependent hydrolase
LDLLIANGTVVTMNPRREVLEGADIVVEGGRIAKVGKATRDGHRPLRRIDAGGKIVLPGLIHGHLHACQTLFRNRADGLELLDWLRERIWPFEAAHDEASMRVSAQLTFAELLKSGATAALDMGTVRHTDVIFEVARDCGFRLTGGKAMMDAGQGLPAGLRETLQGSLDESDRLLKAWHGAAQGRLRYAYAPRFVLSCSDELMREVARRAHQNNVRIHTHASENAHECDAVRQRTGLDNVDYLHQAGVSGPHVTLAHCVWLTAQEQRILRETKTVVCHCPSSNLKLASGIAKIPEMMDDGIPVALGADGAPCNNNLDIWQEMRLAALLHKPRVGPTAMSPSRVLEMATVGGARALGLEAEVGSIEEGKLADLTLVDLGEPHAVPFGDDVLGRLVYSARAHDVTDVVIGGRIVMQGRELLTLDERAIVAAASKQSKRLIELAA